MPFANLYKGLDLRPGSDDFRRAMGFSSGSDPARSVSRDDDEMLFISAAEFKKNTGRDIRDVLAGFAGGGSAGGAAGGASTAPPAAAPPDAAPQAPAAAPGAIIVNPLLDLDLAPVRPGDLITAASFNALIAAIASLHIRISLLEARGGMTTPTPTPGTSEPPEVTGKPPNLLEAYLMKRGAVGKETLVLLAKGSNLSGITGATLLMRNTLGRAGGSIKLTRWRAIRGALLFDIAKPSRALLAAKDIELRVVNPDGEDKVAVEEPTRADRDAFEAALLKVEDPLDLFEDEGAILRSTGKAGSMIGNLR